MAVSSSSAPSGYAHIAIRSLFQPMWMAVWLVAAVGWCAALNVLYVAGAGEPSILGPVSVIPIFGYTTAVLTSRQKLVSVLER